MVYVNPRPHIELADHDEFLASLPPTGHYQDVTIRALAVQMRKLWLGALRNMYQSFARSLNDEILGLEDVTDDDEYPDIDLAGEQPKSRLLGQAQKAADKALKEWRISDEELERLAQRSRNLADRLMKRAINVVAKQKGLSPTVKADAYDEFLEQADRSTCQECYQDDQGQHSHAAHQRHHGGSQRQPDRAAHPRALRLLPGVAG